MHAEQVRSEKGSGLASLLVDHDFRMDNEDAKSYWFMDTSALFQDYWSVEESDSFK